MDDLVHETQPHKVKLKKKQIKKLAASFGLPENDVKKAANDLIDMNLVRVNKDNELEVFDGKEWQQIKL